MNSIARRLSRAWHRILGHDTVRIDGQRFLCDPDHVAFWHKVSGGRWETHTFEILSRYLTQDSVYCDVGAWIGPTVLHAARRCRQVICFEPDPVAYRYLCWNIELNALRNVQSFHAALSDRSGLQPLRSFGGRLGDSRSSLLAGEQTGPGVTVLGITWQAFQQIVPMGRVDVLKIDIEGGEFALVPSLENYLAIHKPVVYLSLHAPYLPQAERQAGLEKIVSVMSMYRQCLNVDLVPVEITELTREAARTGFHSYVFTD